MCMAGSRIFRRSLVVLGVVAVVVSTATVTIRHRASRRASAKQEGPDEKGKQMFAKSVGPLLDHSCVRCHGPDQQKGDLRLDSRDAALLGGRSGPALVPGDPRGSLLLQLVNHADPRREMPPKGKLRQNKIAALESWIKDGAPWPGSPPLSAHGDKTIPDSERVGNAWEDLRNPITKLFGGKRLDLWSLQPLTHPAPPVVKDADWVRNPIDTFVLARMEKDGKAHGPEAGLRTLARRLYFDLTGLPPKPEEMDAFLADTSPDAYQHLVDTLLASHEFGEHSATFWGDVIRYSDSNGFDYDEFRPEAWRFRDYVVRSFNADKPYDQFVTEQLAGDEMLAGFPENETEQDRLIATGYLRIGPYDNSAVFFGEADRCRAQVLFDMVETTGAAFLGMNLSCCRCHDHKVDPISQTDYYRLQAVFENVEANDKMLLDLAPTQAVIKPEQEAIEATRAKLADVENSAVRRITAAKLSKFPEADRKLLDQPEESLSPEMKSRVMEINRIIHTTPLDGRTGFNDEEKTAYEGIKAEVKDLQARRTPITPGFLATDAGYWPPATHLLEKGDFTVPKEVVLPGVFSVLDPNPLPAAKTARVRTSGRRTAFAQWLFSKENPLTARVMVNRLWQTHFGEGIHATPNDYGFAGARPSDPALLDWLAEEFMRSGWSIKHMHRLIVNSATYRQAYSSEKSVSHVPCITQKPHRLTAEELRDSMLAVSGRLMTAAGGPPRWPDMPKEMLVNPNLLIENEEKTRGWYPSPHEDIFVRSLYLVQRRGLRLPMLETFDQPDSSLSCGRRNISTVAPQALTLLNSPFAVEVAESFALRIKKEAGEDPESQVKRGFALALQRQPDGEEYASCVAFVKAHSLPDFCLALMNLNEFAYVD